MNDVCLTNPSCESESESYITTDGQSASLSWNKAPFWTYDHIFITIRQLRVCWCGALCQSRGRVYRLQLILALTSAVIFRSQSHGTRDHILLSQVRDRMRSYLHRRLYGSVCRMFFDMETRSVPCRSPGIHLHGIVCYFRIHCCGNVRSEPLCSNGHLCGASLTAYFQRSGVMSQYQPIKCRNDARKTNCGHLTTF
jgi:hypothetical protein